MSVSLRKKQPSAVNWPISHTSFPKVEAGRDEVGGENLLAQHIGRAVNSLVSPGCSNKRIRVLLKSARNCLLSNAPTRSKGQSLLHNSQVLAFVDMMNLCQSCLD